MEDKWKEAEFDDEALEPDENDILAAALGVELGTEPLYVTKWQKWVTVQELTGEERADMLEQCTIVEKKGGKNVGRSNLKKMYPMMAVLSVRNPIPTNLPAKEHPHYREYPGAVDEAGRYIVRPHPQAGKPVFTMMHMAPLRNKSGAALEQISTVVMRLSGLGEQDVDQKKDGSEKGSENEGSTTE